MDWAPKPAPADLSWTNDLRQMGCGDALEGLRLVPLFLLQGPQDPGAMANMPGEMVYVARELTTARLPDRTDPIVVIIIQFILDTALFRVQLTWQYLWRLIDPNETPSLPHPLNMVVGVALTRGTTLWATVIQRAQQRNMIYVLNR